MVACLSCGESNLPTQRFCGACGHPLERDASPRLSEQASLGYTPRHLAEKILGARSALEGERKQVTVLFCDIVGSTPLADRLGADRMHAVLNAFFASALEAVHRFEGTVNQFLGDGLMALFGAPLTHEDHPRRAVLAALAIRDGVLKHSAQWLGEPGGLNVRIGLNTGAVIVGKIGDNLRMDYTAVGDTTNVAARLQGAADPGTILIGEEVYRHVTPYVHSTPLGLRKLKGKADPIPLYRVESELHSGSKPRTPVLGNLIGRDQEVAELDQCFERLAAQRQGCVLVLTGDAGLGKTRLITEARRMAQSKEIRWLEAGCLSFGRTFSYLPFREILTKIFALNDTEGDADKVLKIRAQLDRLFSADAEQFVPFIARMLSLPLVDSALSPIAAQEGAVIGSQVFRSVTNLLERLSENSPTILTFEDWHWADQSSSELLIHLVGLAGRVPIVFLVAMRREAQGPAFELTAALQAPEASGLPWRQIALVPLPENRGNELLKQLLGGGSLSMHLKEQLLQRACGNPFYMIELVHTLIATGAIARNAEGWVPTARFDSNVLPETIEGVILARVDRLHDDAKQVLKTAAVVGRSFFYSVLEALTHRHVDLGSQVNLLKGADLIIDKQGVAELELMFRHPLIQQATYSSLLKERRLQLHQQVADSIEALFAHRLEHFYAVLAYHYVQAENWTKAKDYIFKAGDQARATAADAEALNHYRMVLVATERADAAPLDGLQRAELDRKIGEALFGLGRHEEAETHLLKALDRAGVRYPSVANRVPRAVMGELVMFGLRQLIQPLRRSSNPGPLTEGELNQFRMFNALAWIDFFRDPTRWALDLLKMYKLISSHPTTGEFVLTCSGVGSLFDGLGLYGPGGRLHRRALATAGTLPDRLPYGLARLCYGIHEVMTGNFRSALSVFDDAARICRNSGHLLHWASAHSLKINVKRALGMPSWIDDIQALQDAGADAGHELTLSWAKNYLVYRDLHLGNYDSALMRLDDAEKAAEAAGDFRDLAGLLGERGLILYKLGQARKSFEALERSHQVLQQRHLTGLMVSRPIMCRAQVLLWAAEAADESMKSQALRAASDACQEAKQQAAKVTDEGAADAKRLYGVYEWLRGRPLQARKCWDAAIESAERLEAAHVLGLTHLEIGRRTSEPFHLHRAEELLVSAGAIADLVEVRKSLAEPPALSQ